MKMVKDTTLGALAALLLMSSMSAQAIVNIESLRMDTDQLGWSKSITLSGKGKKGNTDNDNMTLGFGVQLVEERSRTFLIGSMDYGETNAIKDDEAYFAHLRHTHQFQPSWDWEAFTQYEANPLVFDKKRSLFGGGLRKSYKSEAVKVYLGLGGFYEEETATLNNNRLSAQVWRGNVFSTFSHQLSGHAKWFGSFYVQPQLDALENYRAIVALGAESQVTELISLSLSSNYGYESTPLASRKKEDMSYQFGFNINF